MFQLFRQKGSSIHPTPHTLDSVFSDLHSKGVGATPSHAAVISYDDEEKLLGSEVMSMDNPTSLLNMFFLRWLTFLFSRRARATRFVY